MNTRKRYQQTISEIHAVIADLEARVQAGRCAPRLLETYVAAARERTDWVER